MTAPCILITLHLVRHLHFIFKSKYKNSVNRAATGKTFFFVTLTYGSQTDSLHQTVNGLVGNVDRGESLTVDACDFPGLNKLVLEGGPLVHGWPRKLVFPRIFHRG